MASILGAVGNLGQGFIQGRDAYQRFQDQASIIQQHQMAVDQAKRQLAADAAAFSNMGGGMPGAAPPSPMTGTQGPSAPAAAVQPPMPGQASVPSQPTPSVMQAQPMPGTLPQAPQGGPSAAPGPAPASPASVAGGDGMMGQNDPYALIMRVAGDIKRRNPNIDGPTLALAVDRIMGLVAPQLRQQTQILTTQMRESGAGDRANLRADTQKSIADQRASVTERGQDISLQRANMQVQGAMQRIQAIEQNLNQRFASGQGSKARLAAQTSRAREISGQLSDASRRLNALTSALVPQDDPRYKKAINDLNAAQGKLDILDKSLQQDGGSGLTGIDAVKAELAGGPAPGSVAAAVDASTGSPKFVEGQIYTDANGNKARYQGGKFVPVP